MKKHQSTNKRWLLAAVVVAVLLAVKVAGRNLSIELPKHFQDFITLTLSVIIEALPFVMLGMFFSMAVRVWLPHDWLLQHLPKQPFAAWSVDAGL